HHLVDHGVTPGSVVALCLERSPEMVAAFLGILKAGAVYLPLDPTYPADRLAFMLEDAGARVLLADTRTIPRFRDPRVRAIAIDEEGAAIDARPATRLGIAVDEDEAAYVIYTSGSTGRPKGIAPPHRQLLNRLEWMWREYPFAPDEVSCQKTALSFVDSLWELLGPLLRGVPSVILPDDAVRDPRAL